MDRPLQTLRQEFTLKAIGKAAGVSKQAVGQWKRVPRMHLHRIAKTLGKSPYELRPDIPPNLVDNLPKFLKIKG